MPDVTFHNVTLSLGTFVSEILGPVAENFSKYAGPLRPIVDFLASEVPVVSELNKKSSGEPVTFSDLGVILVGLLNDNRDIEKLKTQAEQVRRVLQVLQNGYELVDRINELRASGSEATINFGTFYLTGKPEVEDQPLQDANGNPLVIRVGTKVELEKVPKAGTPVRVVINDEDVDPSKFKVLRNSEAGGKVSIQFTADLSAEYGGRIPKGALLRYLVDAPEEEDASDEDADIGVDEDKLCRATRARRSTTRRTSRSRPRPRAAPTAVPARPSACCAKRRPRRTSWARAAWAST